ncbi:hypothetical protein D3C81_1967040 [compost metagenome]
MASGISCTGSAIGRTRAPGTGWAAALRVCCCAVQALTLLVAASITPPSELNPRNFIMGSTIGRSFSHSPLK